MKCAHKIRTREGMGGTFEAFYYAHMCLNMNI